MKIIIWLFSGVCHFGRATREFIITVFISFLPVIMGAVIAYVWSKSKPGFLEALFENFKTGEVFLYSSAFLVPYVYKKILDAKSNFFSIVIFFLSLYSFFIGAFVFSFVRLEDIMSRKMNLLADNVTLIGWSIIMSTIIVWYYSVWSEHDKSKSIIDINTKNQTEFSEKLNARIGRAGE